MSKISQVFATIKKAKNILIPLHLSPDGDCIGSALTFGEVLQHLHKQFIISSSEEIPTSLIFLPEVSTIQIKDFSKFNLAHFDLLISLDTGFTDLGLFSRFSHRINPSKVENLTILHLDHHPGTEVYGNLSIVQPKASSTAELLFEICQKTKSKISKKMANFLLLGIFTDTGGFQYNAKPSTFRIVARLLELGASLDDLVFALFRRKNFNVLKYYAKVLEQMKIDRRHHFVWSKITRQERKRLKVAGEDTTGLDQFFKVVEGTDFGLMLTEKELGIVNVSLRSRRQKGFDVSKIAKALGGGGHHAAAGARIEMELQRAEKEVLKIARRFSHLRRKVHPSKES